MKRKLIQNLLRTGAEHLAEEATWLLPDDVGAHRDLAPARRLLVDSIARSQELGLLDASDYYFRICSTSAAELLVFLMGTGSGELSTRDVARSQVILTQLLTSKAGRKKTSARSREEQLADAQKRRRDRNQGEGRKRLDVWISAEAAAYLNAIQEIHQISNQAAALELVLAAAMKGQVLMLDILKEP